MSQGHIHSELESKWNRVKRLNKYLFIQEEKKNKILMSP